MSGHPGEVRPVSCAATLESAEASLVRTEVRYDSGEARVAPGARRVDLTDVKRDLAEVSVVPAAVSSQS